MKRLIIALMLSLAICVYSFGQVKNLDSLNTVWQDASQEDTIRLHAARAMFMAHFRNNPDSARKIGLIMLDFARQKNNVSWESTIHKLIGNSYAAQGNYTQALEGFLASHNIAKRTGDKKTLSVTYNNIGLVYYEQGNYPVALRNLLAGFRLSEELNDQTGLSRVTNNLGNVYIRQKNNEKALEYYEYSLKIKQAQSNKRGLTMAHNNIGLVHINLKNYDEAITSLLKSANISSEINDKYALTRAYNNLGQVYAKTEDYQNALRYLNQSIEIKQQIGDKHGIAIAYNFKGTVLLLQKKYNQAKANCEISLKYSEELGILIDEKAACNCLSKAWEMLGNHKKSLQYFKQAKAVEDKLFNQEKTQAITRQEMQYQFEKQQLADSISFHKEKAAQELAFQKDLSKEQNKFNLIVFGGLALLVIGGIYWRSRQKTVKLGQERKVIDKLKQVDQLKDQFLANTSHELRTPLNGIIGLTESLKDGIAGKLPGKAIENLDMIAKSGNRLAFLVDDILDFSKLRHHDIELALSPVDLNSTANIVLSISKPLTKGKNLILINEIPDNIPLVDADENRLQQILHNLIGNAIKFTEKGEIKITAEHLGNTVKVAISDTGKGIAKEKFDTIFESFEQADGSTEREYGGTGLGLTITKNLIELHGGEIIVDSTLGKGSTFSFTIPESATPKQDFETSYVGNEAISKVYANQSEEVAVQINQKTEGHSKILIVDDEPVNRRVLENHLTVAGYEVTEASNGHEAISLIKNGNLFNLILLDVMMPGLSGFDVCKQLRENFLSSQLPIVLLTAKNQVSDLVNGFNLGANDYLTKPFSKNELLSRVKTHLHLHGIHQATSKFVPSEFLKSVGREAITEVVLGDHIQKEITVLFSDVRDYTRLSEKMSPRQNFKFVNAYVGRMGPIIQKNEGFVNQYLGDGIMALFPKQADHALQAAIDMQQTIAIYNERRIDKGYDPISVGMGLHTGPLVMGIIGDVRRNDPAIISDTVNTASRMEGLTKHFGAKIIISENSLETLENKEKYHFRYLGKVQVKGKKNTIGIYECFDGDSSENIANKQESLDDYKKGITHFLNKEFTKAMVEFDKVLAYNPADRVTKYFVNRSAKLTIEGIANDGEVINTMDEK